MDRSWLIFIVGIFTFGEGILSIGDEDIRCDADSCKDVQCEEVPANCNSNQTNAGIYMLSPDFCNCCGYCLVNLGAGEQCSIGDPSNAKHTSICGPGLTCVASKKDQTDGICQKMPTECALEQQSYDDRRKNGLSGSMETRTLCDGDGYYGYYKCIPGQTCHCLHSNGSRIFGDAIFNTIADYMTCACSRAYYNAADILGRSLHPHEHFRCAADGSYDRLQCMNGKCLCVDALDGAPTFAGVDLVDMDDSDVHEKLPCYSASEPGKYYKECEKKSMDVHKEVEEKKKMGYTLVLGYTYPKCDLDGTYWPVQENRTHKYCVDKHGSILTTPLEKANSPLLIQNMDCKCARANTIITTSEKPTCLENGNYSPVQCRRGVCRCVDADGNQKCSSPEKECEEVEESKLPTLKCT